MTLTLSERAGGRSWWGCRARCLYRGCPASTERSHSPRCPRHSRRQGLQAHTPGHVDRGFADYRCKHEFALMTYRTLIPGSRTELTLFSYVRVHSGCIGCELRRYKVCASLSHIHLRLPPAQRKLPLSAQAPTLPADEVPAPVESKSAERHLCS